MSKKFGEKLREFLEGDESHAKELKQFECKELCNGMLPTRLRRLEDCGEERVRRRRDGLCGGGV